MKKKYLIIPIIATLLFSCTSETNDNKSNPEIRNQLTYEVLSERNLSSNNISKSNVFTISGIGSVKQKADLLYVYGKNEINDILDNNKNLGSLFQSIIDDEDDVNIEFDETGIKVVAMDVSHTVLVHLKLHHTHYIKSRNVLS